MHRGLENDKQQFAPRKSFSPVRLELVVVRQSLWFLFSSFRIQIRNSDLQTDVKRLSLRIELIDKIRFRRGNAKDGLPEWNDHEPDSLRIPAMELEATQSIAESGSAKGENLWRPRRAPSACPRGQPSSPSGRSPGSSSSSSCAPRPWSSQRGSPPTRC